MCCGWCIITEPPTVVYPPMDYLAVEGDNVNFFCEAEGTPLPNTQWIFNGVELQDGTKYTIKEHRGVFIFSQLTIHNVTFNDKGVYTCKVFTSFEMLLVNAQLFVQGLRVL